MFHANYFAPESKEELLSALHQSGSEAKVIAGGTDLIPQMRMGKLSPRVLVDPIRLPSIGLAHTNGNIHLDFHLTHSQVLSSTLLKIHHPALVSACQQVGGPPVRNRGTLVGNLANASPAADAALPLLVYDAQVTAECVEGKRIIPLSQLFIGPGRTCIKTDEFISEIIIPKIPPQTKAIFLKLGNRQAMAIAVASIAVRLSLDELGQVKQARIALGSVAPTPLRAYQAECTLECNPLREETILQAALETCETASPISDLRASGEYRRKMVQVLAKRALQSLCSEFMAEKTNA